MTKTCGRSCGYARAPLPTQERGRIARLRRAIGRASAYVGTHLVLLPCSRVSKSKPVNRRHLPLVLAHAALWLIAPVMHGARVPINFDNLDSRWKAGAVQKEVAPGIMLEMIITHADAPDRLVFLSSPQTDDQPGALGAFAHRLVDSFVAYHRALLMEEDSTKMGYAGRDLRFELVNEKEAVDCELFVFANRQTWWGILYSKPKDTPFRADPVFSRLRKNEPLPEGVVALPTLRVNGIPLTDFQISLEITRNAAGDRVAEIVVSNVPERSDTEQAGVKVGDAIVAIDGRAVTEFSAGVGKDSEIGRIFLNRKRGDTVVLEVRHEHAEKSFSVTLRIPRLLDFGLLLGPVHFD
jgi:hypothetical protein